MNFLAERPIKTPTVKDYFKALHIDMAHLSAAILDLVIEFPTNHFKPHKASFMLAHAISNVVKRNDTVLEIGTGSGLLSLIASKLGATVVATDIDAACLKVAKDNAQKNNLSIDFRLGSLLEPIRAEEKFDVVYFNLPSAPTDPEDQTTPVYSQGGADGRRLIDELLVSISSVLKSGAKVITVQTHLSQPQKTITALEQLGAKVTIYAQSVDPLGKTSLSQLDYMKAYLPPEAQPLEIPGSSILHYQIVVLLAEF